MRVIHAIHWLYKQAMGLSNEKENNEAIQIADKSPLRVLPKYEVGGAIEGVTTEGRVRCANPSLQRLIERGSTVAEQRRQQFDDTPLYEAFVDGETEVVLL